MKVPSKNFNKFYDESGFEWEDICDDFNDSKYDDCFGLDNIIDTIKKYNKINKQYEIKELYKLFTQCKPIIIS